MNAYFEKHPFIQYLLIVLILLFVNLFWRWRNGDNWLDTILLSVVCTVIVGGGVIGGDRLRRKRNQKNTTAKKKVDELSEMK